MDVTQCNKADNIVEAKETRKIIKAARLPRKHKVCPQVDQGACIEDPPLLALNVDVDTIIVNDDVRPTVSIIEDRCEYKHKEFKDLNITGLEHPPVTITIDDCLTNGLVRQTQEHLEVWAAPCIIRLSDILKKSPEFMSKRSSIEFSSYGRLRQVSPCLRNYTLPTSHEDNSDCRCVFCTACCETLKNLNESDYGTKYLTEALIKIICKRTKSLLISQLLLVYQEIELETPLDERICYGFRNAVPVVGILDFGLLVQNMYNIGSDVMWELVKKLGTFIKYKHSYTAALEFLIYFIDVCTRLSIVICRLCQDLDFLDWKLGQVLKINLKTFFLHIFESHVYSTNEFQGILTMAKQIVFKRGKSHQLRKGKRSNTELRNSLSQIRTIVVKAKELWSKRKEPPFNLEIYNPVKHNIFKIAQLRNPFEQINNNETCGYEVIKSSCSGRLEFRNAPASLISRITTSRHSQNLLAVSINNPADEYCCFQANLYRHNTKLSTSELKSMADSKDIEFIKAHGHKVELCTKRKDYYQDYYLSRRRKFNLDEVESPLPPELEKYLNNDFFNYYKRRYNTGDFITQIKKKKRTYDRTWPSYFFIRRRRFCVRVLRKKVRKFLRKRKSRKVRSRRLDRNLPTLRYDYSFGGIPEKKKDPKSILMESQKWELVEDAISSAIQLGIASLSSHVDFNEKNYRHVVSFTCVNTNPAAKECQEKNEETFSADAVRGIILLHYDVLAKYDLITVEESEKSPHEQERIWASTVWESDLSPDEKIKKRIDSVEWSTGKWMKSCDSSDANSKHEKVENSKDHMRIAGKKSRDNMITISCEGHVIGQIPKVDVSTPDELLSGAVDACLNHLSIEKPVPTECLKSRAQPPHGHHNHCAQPGQHSNNHGPWCETSKNRGKCEEHGIHVKKASRPGLPVSAGYAEKRQDLRNKLARGKKEKEGSVFCEVPGCRNCGVILGTLKSSGKKCETTGKVHQVDPIVPEQSLEDIDELVNLIEGVKAPAQPHRNSTASETNDTKKIAKKARKKEKKEQKRVEQEEAERQAKIAEEMERQKEEEERLRREAEEKEEELRRKREKRKKKKKSKKGKEENTLEESLAKSSSDAPILASPQSTEVRINNKPATNVETKVPEMVTIRRHASAPDTTVTISVKSDNGEEDVLYTLVNGQVIKNGLAEGVKATKNTVSDKKKGDKGNQKTKKAVEEKVSQGAKFPAFAKSETMKENAAKVNERKGVVNESNSQVTPTRNNKDSKKTARSLSDQHKSMHLRKDDKANEMDVSKLNLPPGVTITMLNEEKFSGSCHNPYVGEFPHSYEEDLPYLGRAETEFEEVVSNKTRRLRNRVNKQKDGTEYEDEPYNFEGLPEKSITRKWNNDHSSSNDSCGTTTTSGNFSRGKRAFSDANSCGNNSMPAQEANKSRLPSTNTRYQGSLGKGIIKSNASVSQYQEHVATQNGRGNCMKTPFVADIPRLNKTMQSDGRTSAIQFPVMATASYFKQPEHFVTKCEPVLAQNSLDSASRQRYVQPIQRPATSSPLNMPHQWQSYEEPPFIDYNSPRWSPMGDEIQWSPWSGGVDVPFIRRRNEMTERVDVQSTEPMQNYNQYPGWTSGSPRSRDSNNCDQIIPPSDYHVHAMTNLSKGGVIGDLRSQLGEYSPRRTSLEEIPGRCQLPQAATPLEFKSWGPTHPLRNNGDPRPPSRNAEYSLF